MASLVTAVAAIGAVGLSTAGATTVATTVATTPVSGQALEGQLLVAHGDNFATGAMVMQTELRTASGDVPLAVPATQHAQTMALAGTQVHVQVQGSTDAGAFAAARISPAAEGSAASERTAVSAAAPKRSMRIALVLMRLPGSSAEPVSKASAQASTFGSTNSVADWYRETSGGQVTVTGTVYGYYTGVRSCDIATQLAAAAAAAKKGGYVASDYDHLVVYTPEQSCGFAGIGWVGSNGVFLNGGVTPGVMEHELGHNLGLWHSGQYACGGGPQSGSCLIDYGDDTDVMGSPYDNHGYNAQHKYKLGWIPSSEVRNVTSGAETIALTASEDPLAPGAIELIHVRAPDGAIYAIDRRASVGYDTGLSGVWIRRVASVNSDDTELVRNGALPAGASYSDSTHDVTITTVSDSGPTASVRVCVGPCPVGSQSTGKKPSPVTSITARKIVAGSRSSAANAGIKLTVPGGREVAVGHTVVVAAFASKAKGAASCRDSRGNRYTVNIDRVGAQRLVVCSAYVKSRLAPGSSITVSYPGFNGSVVASANDFAGLKASPRIDRRTSNAGSSGVISSRATARTTKASELVFGVVAFRGTSTLTPGAGYTRTGAASAFSGNARMTIVPEFKIASAMSAYSVRGVLSSGESWRAAIVTFFKA